MIDEVFKKYFTKKYPNNHEKADKFSRDYSRIFHDFIKIWLEVDWKEDIPYYNIKGKKYKAMYYIDDKQWINEHIKVSDNLFNNIDSQLLPLFINYAKKSDDVVIEFYIDEPESQLIKEHEKEWKSSNTLFISEDLDNLIWNNISDFQNNLIELFKKKKICNIKPLPEIKIIESYVKDNDEYKKEEEDKNLLETNIYKNYWFNSKWIHFFTKTKYNLLWYNKDWFNEDWYNIIYELQDRK